jgi:hypothetical protein
MLRHTDREEPGMNGSRTRARGHAAVDSKRPRRRPGHEDPGSSPARARIAGKALLAALLLLIIAMLVIAML